MEIIQDTMLIIWLISIDKLKLWERDNNWMKVLKDNLGSNFKELV